MTSAGWVAAAALPYALVPAILLWRLRDSVELDRYPATLGDEAEPVSIVLPARNEAVHIEGCMRSILASTHPRFELIVVDDHSSDGTGEIARRVAAEDPRARVLNNPDLPEGWFGKQWACHNGAAVATGRILLFTDADTRHGTECLSRAVNAMRTRRADLLSVAGQQLMESFWERLLQPHILMMILARYGGTETVSRATSPYAKIANGQYLMLTRAAYDQIGGHAAVRDHVGEDLRLAQTTARAGLSVHLVAGLNHLVTRMYSGLGDIVRGWGKNVWAAGRDTLPLGQVGRAVLRLLFPLPQLWEIAPPVVGTLALAGILSAPFGWWALAAYTFASLGWIPPHHASKQPLWYCLLNPLASAVVFWIFASAAWRGDRVEWKGRAYISR
jgi:chlorobactene glucosyltransferase